MIHESLQGARAEDTTLRNGAVLRFVYARSYVLVQVGNIGYSTTRRALPHSTQPTQQQIQCGQISDSVLGAMKLWCA